MKKRTATVLKWIGFAAIAVCFFYAALLGLANRSLRRAYAALESDGRPMKAEQIIPPKIPDADNAALVYKAVVLQLKAERAGEEDLFAELSSLAARILSDKPDAAAKKQFIEFSERPVVQDAMTRLRSSGDKKGCRYDIDYTKGAGLLLPHLTELLSLSRILCARARVEADAGNASEAWGNVITAFQLATALHDEPMLISQLIRIAQFNLACDALRAVATSYPPDQQQNDEIIQLLDAFDDMKPLVSAMDAERLLLGEWAFNLPKLGLRKVVALEDSNARHSSGLVAFLSPLAFDHAAYLAVLHAYAKNAAEPYSKHDATLDQELLNDVPRYCVLTRMVVPAYSATKGRYISMIAQARVARAGLAVLKYVQNGNRYPKDLDVLQPGNRIDPFTGSNLVYHAASSGFTLYSVGENLTDDGGAISKTKRSGDIVWHYSTDDEAKPEVLER